MVTNEPVVLTGTTETPQLQSYVELQQLMDQMEGLARTFASAEGTSVEMQLNPENLGRLVLTVTEKNGKILDELDSSVFTQNSDGTIQLKYQGLSSCYFGKTVLFTVYRTILRH